jgi:serine phosphatase RsbU (regulator of sigma subunit)
MDLIWSLEETARTSDEAVVRRRYDQRNLFALSLLLLFFAFVSFLELVTRHRSTVADVLIAATNFALVVVMLMFVRDVYRLTKAGARGNWAAARWIRNHLTATTLTYVVVQYAFVLAFTRDDHDWMAWIMVMPLLTIGFRMLMAELVLLHSMLVFGGLASAVILGTHVVPFYVGIFVMNLLTLGVKLFFSSRMRKEVVADFTERRSQAREQIRMRDELRYARELQLSMLPEHAPLMEWVDLAATSVPATEVGGDYYDYFLADDRVALVCGDVAGHGMASGLVLSAMRSGFTLLRDSLTDPAAVLKRLHDLVAETSRRRMLVTVAVVLLDHATRRATIASAGHPPVVVAHADGTVETIDLYAPPLGVRLPVEIPQRAIDFAPGDIFVLHSDGIYETLSEEGETYGIERLMEVVRGNVGLDAEALRNVILAELDGFRGRAVPEDDVTLVVARVR